MKIIKITPDKRSGFLLPQLNCLLYNATIVYRNFWGYKITKKAIPTEKICVPNNCSHFTKNLEYFINFHYFIDELGKEYDKETCKQLTNLCKEQTN